MSNNFEINKPFGFKPDAETQKLREAVKNFNKKICPKPTDNFNARSIARELIAFRASQKPINYGIHSF